MKKSKELMWFMAALLLPPALTILYDIASLFWCYVILNQLIFNFSFIYASVDGIEVVGPTFTVVMENILQCAFPILFVLLSIATAVLLTVVMFKKRTSQKFRIVLCAFSILTFVAFVMIPANGYMVSLWAIVRGLSTNMDLRYFYTKLLFWTYVILSIAVIVKNILHVVKKAFQNENTMRSATGDKAAPLSAHFVSGNTIPIFPKK